MEQPSEVPVACNLSAFDLTQSKRHERLLNEVLTHIQTVRELENGYEFSLPGEREWYLKLAERINLERQCCSFLTFEQGINERGHVWLRLTGDNNARQFLKGFLGSMARDHHAEVPGD